MSSLATRLLVLGVVRIFEPANAYQLRRELLSWEIDRWANVNPGSIYSMLGTLTRQGVVDRHELEGESGRPVTVYTVTDSGRTEFERLLLDAIETVSDTADPVDLRAAMSFMPFLGRARVTEAVERRIAAMRLGREWMDRKVAALETSKHVPPHVVYEFGLEFSLLTAQLDWLEKLLADLRDGALSFAGEPTDGWVPIDDDPGWRMVRERERYLDQLADPA